MRRAVLAAAIVVVFAASTPPALAQASRTFVSGGGNDANSASNCGRSAPCRSFGAAIGVTNAGGEIVVLDSAGYGPFTIGKAITITAIGVEAAITSTTTDGIIINAGASDVVTLRGLTLTQTGTSGNLNGITFNSGGTLNIQNCAVRNFTSDGIHLVPTNAAKVNVSDAIVSNNGSSDGSSGIAVYFPSGAVTAFFERVQAVGNANAGIFIASSGPKITAAVANSIATGNITGVLAQESNSTVMLINSEIYNNSFQGVSASGGNIILGNAKIYNNTHYGFANFGAVETFGNNYFVNNGGSAGLSLTPIAQQ